MSSHKSQFKDSLTRTTLIKMGIRIAVVIIAVTLVSYWHVVSILESQILEQLQKYIVERGQRESSIFVLAQDNHVVLKKELLRRFEVQQSNQERQAQFDQLFVKLSDESTRSREKLDTTVYIGVQAKINADIQHRVLTFYNLLNAYGPAWHNRFTNTYIMAPENFIAVYWPGQPWTLNATADFYMPDQEYFYISDQTHNPTRKVAWTGLYFDAVAKLWMVSVETPVDDIQNRHIATIGHDIVLNELMDRAINDHIEGAYNIIFRKDGRLIAHPEKMADIQKKKGLFNILQSGDQSLIRIFQLIKEMGSKQVVIDNTEGNEYLAVTRIEGPDWFFVTVYPKSLLVHLAFDTASFILILGLFSLLFEITVLFVVLRKQVAKPLHDFLDATEQITKGNFNIKLDVTRQDELGRLANSFNAMAHEVDTREEGLKQVQASLRQANMLKDEFLANTSHELRTPLNGIIGIAESLIDGATGQLTDKTKTNLVMIVGSGKRLATLVNDILDFSQLKHKTLELQLKPIGLREIVDIVLALSQSSVVNKPVQLVNTIPGDLPPAQADENRLQQILYNLIGNAIKFTDSGTVEISATVVNQHLEMVVSDTGIGVPEDKLERIFKSFEQAEGSTARKYGGTGLGLAVTKQLVQLHGGKIWVKSTVDQGSQFFLTLPIAEGESSQLSVNSLSLVQSIFPVEVTLSTSDKVKATSGKQLNILIVDDEPVNLQVLNNYLSLQNYHITQATSGQESLSLIEEGLKPDAILLDVMMPKMTGYTVTKKIRERWKADEVPILLLTAKNQVADLVVGFESGANDYLTKPISKDELLARLKTHLQLKKLKEKTLHLALENERMKAEIEVTHRIQKMILPKEEELDQLPNLEIAGFMEPADEVGGDYYDVIQHNGRVLIGIGDVTGHGLESGMLMLMAQAGIRTLLENEEQDAVKFLNSLNGMIFKNAQERLEVDKNLTLSLLEYQPAAQTGGVLRISGHHEDIIVVRNGHLERIDTGDLGFQVGFVDDIAEFVAQIEVTLNTGDLVILYTDGITEAENQERKEYGIKRLCEVVEQNWQQSVKGIRQAVIDDVRQYIGQQKVFDDITLVVFKQK
jgi:signal transduction histidine kinase/serine phosphatase RsbU (regulator of sigma subunit)